MYCSDVGGEIWVFFTVTGLLAWLFLVKPTVLQGWLRARRERGTTFLIPGFLLAPGRAWVFRLFAVIPVTMWLVALVGVYCFFAGPELPPIE